MFKSSRLLSCVIGLTLLAACGTESEQGEDSPSAGVGGVGASGQAGTANTGNVAVAGTSATGGDAGAAGSGGSVPAGGTGGDTGTGGSGGTSPDGGSGGDTGTGGSGGTSPGGAGGSGGSVPAGGEGGSGAPTTYDLTVQLIPQAGVTGMQRVNFAIPLAPGQLSDDQQIVVRLDGSEIAAARRGLARYPDGSWRSVQIQVDVALPGGFPGDLLLDVSVGDSPQTSALSLVSVADTLDPADGTAGPRVWALLPADWLASSGVAGPMLPASSVAGTNLSAWNEHCDYAGYDVDAFLVEMSTAGVWLYDRGTVMYRGYTSTGEQGPLESAYRETSIYRSDLTGAGVDTRIGVPGRVDDLKYHYTQNLAIHYLLTGDDRFREAAEDVAERISSLWTSPGYAGGADFWTERHAGFALLAYEWAAIVSDDQADQFRQLADEAVTAYIQVQETYPVGYTDPDTRCFAHHADAHGEGYGYFGCSPWMSAILAESLDLYATERGGAEAAAARQSIVKLGRAIARDGLDASGKPYYWVGVGTDQDEVDPYDEHWGESAYVVAMAWYHDGRSDAALRAAADQLVQQFRDNASTPHMRSFNWQCRAAVTTPWYLSQ